MLIDITLEMTAQKISDVPEHRQQSLVGHVGTHFDVMEQEFPLNYTRRKGIVFDVSSVQGRDIDLGDIPIEAVERDMFVAFRTGFIEEVGYGEEGYFFAHPQLSDALIDALLERGISIIGVDFAGIRRGKEHVPKDRLCANHGVFVIENLCNLKALLDCGGRFTAHTYPVRYTGMTGLPCRVIAEVE